MKIEIIEIILISIVVALQVYVFFRTYSQIGIFKNIIPNLESLKVSKLYIPSSELNNLTPKEILANIASFKKDYTSQSNYETDFGDSDISHFSFEENQHQNSNEKIEVNIIESDAQKNYIFEKILFSVNNYLIRNRGASSDFNLIKDIIERNTDAVEEDINLSIGVPLYLGLMGTMMGIVIALFNMPDLGIEIGSEQTGQKLDEGIAMLIGGVKVAMIASFVGLMLTIINSGWIFKGSRSFSEARKNEFYTFIQIELLPLINQGLASTLDSLQRNLLKFNDEFSTNLRGLSGIFDSSRSAIKEQKELIDALDRAKVSDMTRYNVAVLKQLDVSVSKFELFNSYLTNVTQFVENSQNIVSRTNELLDRTDNFKNISDNIEDKLNQGQLLITFLSEHFNKLEQHKEYTSNAVADVGHSISETFKELKEHIQNSSDAVKQFTIDETDLLKKALSEGKTNLGNLEHLSTLKSDVSQFKNSSATQGERLKQAIDDLNKNMAKSIAVLEQIEKRSFSNRAKDLTSSIKNLFKSK
jgi:hypothetical protein